MQITRGLEFDAGHRIATRRFLALIGEHIIHKLVRAFVGHHAPLGRSWRVLALIGEHIIHERVLALVGHDAPPGRMLDATITAAARRGSRVVGLVAIGALG